MKFPDLLFIIAGLLQLGVACYALRLSRRFGAGRVGWTLFSAFALLALEHWLLSEHLLAAMLDRSLLRNLGFASASVLLLVGMAHLEGLLRRQREAEQVVQQAKADLAVRVLEETQKLSQANEELRQTAVRLKAEISERESQQALAEKTHKELLSVSRQAGMSEVATAVLHNVGNVLNSVNISASLVADHVTEFRIDNIARAANLMRQNEAQLAEFLANDPKGKQLPEYLAMLASHLRSEQTLILKEIGFVRTKIEHIKQIVATQQNYGKVMGLAEKVRVEELVDDVLRIQAVELAERQVQVRREYEADLPNVVADKHKVLQILLNLLSNAKHACLESSQGEHMVTVRVTNGDDKVRVAVNDNGVGIPAANLKTIFNHGFTTRKHGGHGFGLHGSALAAKDLGGAIAVQSEGPGRGATFTLEIPLKRPSATLHS